MLEARNRKGDTMANGAATRVRRSREKILAAAEDVFLHAGFLGANMDAIAEKAVVSKQTVYAHFQSKEALFLEMIAAMTGGAARAIGEDVEDRLDDRPVSPMTMRRSCISRGVMTMLNWSIATMVR